MSALAVVILTPPITAKAVAAATQLLPDLYSFFLVIDSCPIIKLSPYFEFKTIVLEELDVVMHPRFTASYETFYH